MSVTRCRHTRPIVPAVSVENRDSFSKRAAYIISKNSNQNRFFKNCTRVHFLIFDTLFITVIEVNYYVNSLWQVNGLYVKSAHGILHDVSDYTDDECNMLDYYHLLIDAQTGEMIQKN